MLAWNMWGSVPTSRLRTTELESLKCTVSVPCDSTFFSQCSNPVDKLSLDTRATESLFKDYIATQFNLNDIFVVRYGAFIYTECLSDFIACRYSFASILLFFI